jgi:hypothetical protein
MFAMRQEFPQQSQPEELDTDEHEQHGQQQ